MTICFERPIGAPADVKEMEYLSALTQSSMPALRSNGCLHAEDIVNYLTSRHGVRSTAEDVQKEIMMNLAGNFQSDPSQGIDICQITAMLLLPHLKKIANSNDETKIQQLFGKGLQLMLAELPHDSSCYDEDGELILSCNLIRELLAIHGENDVSPQVLEDMVRAAGGENEVLDLDTLMLATTSDLALYNLAREDFVSTNYEDALQASEDAEEVDEETPDDANRINRKGALIRLFTASSIDMTAETYGSMCWVTLTWIAVVLLFFAFLWGSLQSFYPVSCSFSTSPFKCIFERGITEWLTIFAQLSTLGAVFVTMASMGNSIFVKNRMLTAFGIVLGVTTLFFTTVATYFVQVKTILFSTKHFHLSFGLVYATILMVGCVLITLQIVQLLRIVLPARAIRSSFFASPGTTRMEQRTKNAAAFKVAKMVDNALDVHATPCQQLQNLGSTHLEIALLKYQEKEHQMEPCGGIIWGWKRILNGTVFREDGVWFHARLVSSNVSQVFVTLFFAGVWGVVTFDKALKNNPNSSDVSLFPNSNARHLETATTSPSAAPSPFVLSPLEFALLSPFQFANPYSASYQTMKAQDKRALYMSLYVGSCVASLACFAIAVIFLPSVISTVFKFRTGVLPSLRSKSFLQYRFAQDHSSSLIGRAFWGSFFTGGVCLYAFGTITASFVLDTSRIFVSMIAAQIVGMAVVYILKVLVLIVLRRYFFAAFYRKKPAAANIMGAMLECWHLGLATGQMFLRSLFLFFITAFYIGRIDTPLLAPGVGQIGPLILDGGPFAFQKDILLHEAHRHPYIERLGLLYLIKLRNGDSFATRAGSCWRLLFTQALMPWLRKYRVRSVTEQSEEQRPAKSLDWTNPSTVSNPLVRTDSSESDSSDEEDVNQLLERVRQLETENFRLKRDMEQLRRHEAENTGSSSEIICVAKQPEVDTPKTCVMTTIDRLSLTQIKSW